MFSSAEINVVETFGSPKRLNRSSETSRMRSAVRRGAFFGIVSASGGLQGEVEFVERGIQRRYGAAEARRHLARLDEVAVRVRQHRGAERDPMWGELRRNLLAPCSQQSQRLAIGVLGELPPLRIAEGVGQVQLRIAWVGLDKQD